MGSDAKDLGAKNLLAEKMKMEWRDYMIVPIYRWKGDIQNCGNYKIIKLMSPNWYYIPINLLDILFTWG